MDFIFFLPLLPPRHVSWVTLCTLCACVPVCMSTYVRECLYMSVCPHTHTYIFLVYFYLSLCYQCCLFPSPHKLRHCVSSGSFSLESRKGLRGGGRDYCIRPPFMISHSRGCPGSVCTLAYRHLVFILESLSPHYSQATDWVITFA